MRLVRDWHRRLRRGRKGCREEMRKRFVVRDCLEMMVVYLELTSELREPDGFGGFLH
jgi:hypothetical protein